MQIETERLILHPIDDREMEALIARESDPELRQAYGEMLQGCRREPEKRLWYALWLIELKSEPGAVVGDLCFKGLNPNGDLELGYGLREGCCGRGYMTEAAKAVSAWALRQPGVRRVEAETAPDNAPSQRVLLRAGFVPTGVFGEEGPRYTRGRTRTER